MSCITDKGLSVPWRERGSILMEFVLVLPIYFVLFGYVLLLGDLGLKTIALATGDRDAAMDAGDRWGYSYSVFDGNQIEGSGLRPAQSATLRADKGFNGAWSWQAAGISKFTYRMPGWMSGLLVYPYLRYGNATSDGALPVLSRGGSIELRSKDIDNVWDDRDRKAKIYNYYTLKRTELARADEAYRNWAPNQLVSMGEGLMQHWEKGVFAEPYANSSGEKLDSGGWSQGADELPSQPNGVSKYERYDQFVTWSQ